MDLLEKFIEPVCSMLEYSETCFFSRVPVKEDEWEGCEQIEVNEVFVLKLGA